MKYAKAFVGAALAGLVALGSAVAEGGISASEWIGAGVATLTVLAGVWATPNRDDV